MKHFTLFSLLFFCFTTFSKEKEKDKKRQGALKEFKEQAYVAPGIQFLGEQILSTKTPLHKSPVGGLSGLEYHAPSNTLYAISDDRSQRGPARWYEFDLNLKPKVEVSLKKVVPIKDRRGKTPVEGSVDYEGIARLGSQVFISSEGYVKALDPVAPKITIHDLEGKYLSEIPAPPHFWKLKKVRSFGIRHNKALESLDISKDGKWVFTAGEHSLHQDGKTSNLKRGSHLRLTAFHTKGYHPAKQWVYRLSKYAQTKSHKHKSKSGLVDLISLDADEFLTLERHYIKAVKHTSISLFHTSCKDATDVKNHASLLKIKSFKPCDKKRLLDLDSLLFELKPTKGITTDNIEGMVFGPSLPTGERLLIFVSDNNFSDKQKTQFLYYKWGKELPQK